MIKIYIFAVLFCVVACRPIHAQTDSARWKHIEYVAGASVAFSFFDYWGFNLVNRTKFISPYRVLEGIVQLAISYFLYKTCGISSTIAFNLMWWTWDDDIFYYGWADLFNLKSPNALNPVIWENRAGSGLNYSAPYWAGWTPIGLLRHKNAPIARNALLAQAFIGFSVSMAILW
jgi:hypothetical protein